MLAHSSSMSKMQPGEDRALEPAVGADQGDVGVCVDVPGEVVLDDVKEGGEEEELGIRAGTGAKKSVLQRGAVTLRGWYQLRRRGKTNERQKKGTLSKNQHSYKQKPNSKDEIVGGKRKKRSALHGTGVSKWWEAKNWYYILLDWSWGYVFFLITLWYVVTMLFWTLVSWPLADQIECEVGQDNYMQSMFGVAAVFAVSNVLTLGFGPCLPSSYAQYTIGSISQYFGLLLSVIVLSVVVSKYQIPKPDIIFSKKALITTRNGEPVLLIRVGNRRVNLLYEIRVSVAVLKSKSTVEGERYIEYVPLQVLFPPSMTAVATITHKINRESPLYDFLVHDEDRLGIAMSVSFSGTDSIYNDMLNCTTQYKGSDLEIGDVRFGDMMERMDKGKGVRANFQKFDSLVVGTSPQRVFEGLLAFDDPEDSESRSARLGTRLDSEDEDCKKDGDDFAITCNDITGARVRTELPKVVKKNVIYLFYGALRHRDTFTRVCPYSRSVFMFLVEAGLDFKVIDVDWGNKPDWFLEINSQGTTPVLAYQGEYIVGSHVIFKTICRNFPAVTKSISERKHLLPVPVFDFQETMERVNFPLLLASPEEMQKMLRPGQDGAQSGPCPAVTFSNSGGDKNSRSLMQEIESVKLLKSAKRPVLSSGELMLVVPIKYRYDTIFRFHVATQQVELVCTSFDVSFKTALVDFDNLPNWLSQSSSSFPLMLGGEQDQIISGVDEILRFVEQTRLSGADSGESDKGAAMAGWQAALRLAKALELACEHFLFSQDTAKGVQHDEGVRVALESIQALLQAASDAQSRQEGSLLDNLHWEPYLSNSGTSAGVFDWILAPVLFWARILLRELGEYSWKANNLTALDVYTTAMSNTGAFRRTATCQYPDSFYVLHALKSWADRQDVDGARMLKERGFAIKRYQELEEENAQKLFGASTLVQADRDGSVTVMAGTCGPALEMNTLYLAIGCVKRSEDDLAKVCPYSRVVEMAALEAGIPVEILKIDLGKKPGWFTKHSTGTAPNAYWNGIWHNESSHILDDMLPKLFPERYQAINQPLPAIGFGPLENVHGMALFNIADKIAEEVMVAKKNDPEKEAKRQALLALLRSLDTALQTGKALTGSPFLSGLQGPSVADVALVCSIWRVVVVVIGWFQHFDLVREGLSGLALWIDAFKARPSFTKSIPPNFEPFLIYFMCKFYADKNDPENSGMWMTPEIENNLKESNQKTRLEQKRAAMNAEELKTGSACKLMRCEVVLGALEKALVDNNSNSYLCGDSIGLADVVIFSHIKFLHDACTVLHPQLDFKQRGFPQVVAYLERISTKARFRLVISPLVPHLLRLHFVDRFVDTRPHFALTPSEREGIFREIASLKSKNAVSAKKRGASSRGSSKSTTSRQQTSSSLNGSTRSNDGGVEDLLFCI